MAKKGNDDNAQDKKLHQEHQGHNTTDFGNTLPHRTQR
jgi:hypothetical protein